jgi:hypothetical protein
MAAASTSSTALPGVHPTLIQSSNIVQHVREYAPEVQSAFDESDGGCVAEQQTAIQLVDTYSNKLAPSSGDTTPYHVAKVIEQTIAVVDAAMESNGLTFTDRGIVPPGMNPIGELGPIQLEGTDAVKAREALAAAVASACGHQQQSRRAGRSAKEDSVERYKLLHAAGVRLSAEFELDIATQLNNIRSLCHFLRINQGRQTPDQPHPWVVFYVDTLSAVAQAHRKRRAPGTTPNQETAGRDDTLLRAVLDMRKSVEERFADQERRPRPSRSS